MSKIYCVAGGTGGHVFPAKAVAIALQRAGHRVTLIVDRRGRKYLGDHPYRCVFSAGVMGKSVFAKLKAFLLMGFGYIQSLQWLFRERPDLIIGFGGYASLPMVLAAQHLGKKTLVHEQNALMGRVNRLLSKSAEGTLLSYSDTKLLPEGVEGIFCGNPTPLADEAPSLHLERSGREITLLVLGGSQGASVFDQVIPKALELLPEQYRKKLMLVQQLTTLDVEETMDVYSALGISADCRQFIPNASALMPKVDLLIARSGGGTCAEVLLAKVPSILVPLPSAADNHQWYNAESIASIGGADVILQKELKAHTLAQKIEEILFSAVNSQRTMKAALQNYSFPEPLPKVVQVVEQTLRGRDV